MDLTILGEYGLKTALRVALNIKKLYTSEVDNGIISAFEFALNDWSKHTPTTSDKVRLSKVLEEYIQSSMSYEALDTDTQKFIDCFKKRLSEQPAAHRYLMTLRADMQEKSEEQNLLEHHKTQESVLDLKSRMEELNMAPQYIRALLKELPLEQGLERTELVLEEMLTNGRIHSEGAKRLVLEFARFLFEHTDKISEETKLLREAGDSFLAETLEEIKRVLTGESKQSLTAVYEKHKEQARQNEIRVLKELIEAAQIKFSFGEAREFYERLIKLAPTIELHFNYAYLLQNLNDIDKARSHYEEVLQVLRELSKENPELHKPNLATVLNNWGSLLKSANEFQQAQACYREALEIRRKLAEQNPEVYKPYVAITLNNIGNLLCDTNELQQAQACYKEALQKYRELPEHSLEVYKPDMAMVLNNLGILLKNTNELQQAQSCYEEALKIHQESAKHNQETYKPDLATTQQNLTLLYLQQGKKEEAEEAYQEAYDIYQDLASHYPRAYGIDYAQLLVIGFDLLGKPKKYLEEAKAILDKYPEHSKAQELLSIIEQLDKR
ncbi:tetratricopeptide repeat protein [uncultured Porphyromonas sp.]|uniref:tetratricopeptide repeat protein n=1 Tax=uncultured Porphyromonas sp. TaxID=159274 RepID=UPI00260967A1|nr:tetratricopeptide repeat protein [uncultured Porphyromonas sp.]